MISVGRLCEIKHIHPELITHPLNESYLDLSAGTPQPGRTGSGLKECCCVARKWKRLQDSKPGRMRSTVDQTFISLSLFLKSHSLCLFLLIQSGRDTQTPAGCSLSINFVVLMTGSEPSQLVGIIEQSFFITLIYWSWRETEMLPRVQPVLSWSVVKLKRGDQNKNIEPTAKLVKRLSDFVGIQRLLVAFTLVLKLVGKQWLLGAHRGEPDLILIIISVLPQTVEAIFLTVGLGCADTPDDARRHH